MPGDGNEEADTESIPEDHDIETLRSAQAEFRVVLDHQIQNFTDLDNKVAKTFRLDAILLGLLLTTLSFVLRTDAVTIDPYVNTFTVLAVIALIVSFVIAIITYTTTGIETGIGSEGMERVIERRYTEREWLVLLLRSEAEWMRENERLNGATARYLWMSHVALVLAVLAVFAGIIWVHTPF